MNVERIENLVEFPPFTTPAEYYRVDSARATAIVLPAMGTKAGFYQQFAQGLSEKGFSVLLPDIPGTGSSRPRPSRATDYGYRELIRDWVTGLVDFAREKQGGAASVLMGHSLGSQLGTLACGLGCVRADALVSIAGGHLDYRHWDGASAAKVWCGAGLFRGLSSVLGYLPGQHVGFGGPQARTLIRDWSRFIYTGEVGHITNNRELQTSLPMLALGYEGDFYAPVRSVSALAAMLEGEVEIIRPVWPGSPHSSWAKHPAVTIARIDAWLSRQEI